MCLGEAPGRERQCRSGAQVWDTWLGGSLASWVCRGLHQAPQVSWKPVCETDRSERSGRRRKGSQFRWASGLHKLPEKHNAPAPRKFNRPGSRPPPQVPVRNPGTTPRFLGRQNDVGRGNLGALASDTSERRASSDSKSTGWGTGGTVSPWMYPSQSMTGSDHRHFAAPKKLMQLDLKHRWLPT